MSDTEIGPVDWLRTTVRITRPGEVYFGDHKVPGLIVDGGIAVRPGKHGELNRMTIEFVVGHVVLDDTLPEQNSPKDVSVSGHISINGGPAGGGAISARADRVDSALERLHKRGGVR